MNTEAITRTTQILARQQRLLDQLVNTGPEHFDQEQWFAFDHYVEDETGKPTMSCTEVSDQFSESEFGVEPSMIGQIKFNDCGTSACLAGHGAVVMARAAKRGDVEIAGLTPGMVADYFHITTSWFDSSLPSSHPAAEWMDEWDDVLPENTVQWVAQVMAIGTAIREGNSKLAELYATG